MLGARSCPRHPSPPEKQPGSGRAGRVAHGAAAEHAVGTWWARRSGSPGGAGQPAILHDGLSRRDRPFSMTDYLDVTAFPAEPWVFRAVILAQPPALPARVKPHGSSCAEPNRCLLWCSRHPLHRQGLQASSRIPHGSSQLRVCSRMDPPAANIPAGTSRTLGWPRPPTAPWGPSRGMGAPCLCQSVSRWDPTPPSIPGHPQEGGNLHGEGGREGTGSR